MQFQDQDMEKPKDSFSIGLTEVDSSLSLARSMIQDLTNQFPGLSKAAARAPTAEGPQAISSPTKDTVLTQTAPLNAENLQQQQLYSRSLALVTTKFYQQGLPQLAAQWNRQIPLEEM
jgi:hypothetical protein